VGWKGTILTFPDGTTWTKRSSGISDRLMGVTYGNGLFVTVVKSRKGRIILTSSDGTTWTSRTLKGPEKTIFYGVTYSE
jgi:hypothetical protein